MQHHLHRKLGFIIVQIYLSFVMKKVRISKKNPNNIIKLFQQSPSPNKQLNKHSKSFKNSLKIQQLRYGLQINKLTHRQNIIHSHRYKPSYPHLQMEKYRASCSPREHMKSKSQDKQKQQSKKNAYKRTKRLKEILNRSHEKSPYLQKKYQNKSQRKLDFNSRYSFQHSYHLSKLKTVRLNSNQQKQQSIQIRKTSESQDIINQAKKLMLAGESRKSMFILKPLLVKQPSNLKVLNIAAINSYNIGEYQKSLDYMNYILRLKPDFSQKIYFLKAKIFFKHRKNVQQCLNQLTQCEKVFENSEQVNLQKGQVYLSLGQFQQALQCFKNAQTLTPSNPQIQQKLIQAYQGLKKYDKIIDTVEKLKKLSEKFPIRYQIYKVKALFNLKRYDAIIQQYNKSNESYILYYYGCSLYKKGDYQKSFLILQTSLSSLDEDTSTGCIKLMLLILCKGNDFYEAYHLIQRCQYLNTNRNSLRKQFYFIQGVICMMKRNIIQGLQKLNFVKNLASQQISQFQQYMNSVIFMFLAYGYFSLGNYQKTKTNYMSQLQSYPDISFEGMKYNINLNQGYLLYQLQSYEQSSKIFQKLCESNQKKIQPRFCLAINYINLYYLQTQQKNRNKQLLSKAKQIFQNSVHLVAKYHNNIGANYFYHKSVVHGVLQEWRQAIISIDEAIEKSQENYWRYYYVRALILACIHNFSEAINECSAAINLKQSQPFPYLLRCCCFQIQGDGNYAFKDLQAYIALRPQDKQIHKFAGKLLFQNGAFQDALAAFNHQPIVQNIINQDVFMTKSKTLFLLGRFNEAAQEMFKVNRLNPLKTQAIFDGKMMIILHKLLKADNNYDQTIKQIDQLYNQKNLVFPKCQIFKKTQSHTLKTVCYFYSQRYNDAILQIQKAIKSKQKTILKQSLIEGSTRQDQKDTRLYVSQMNFNISVCHLMLNDLQSARIYAQKIMFNPSDIFYKAHQTYLSILYGVNQRIPGQQGQIVKVQIFPSRNKISNFLKQVTIKAKQQSFYTKLCIPFPKVQPPQIYPNFDQRLIKQFTIQNIQRKSQAPWICKQENTIKFTNKIQKYSRLQIQQSATQRSITEQQIDNSHISVQSIISRRSKISQPKLYQNAKTVNSQNSKKKRP